MKLNFRQYEVRILIYFRILSIFKGQREIFFDDKKKKFTFDL